MLFRSNLLRSDSAARKGLQLGSPLGRFRPFRLGTSLDLDYPAPRPPLVALAITKRKQPVRDPADTSLLPPAFESGTKASCDSCSADITHNVHVRCAETTKPASGEGERLTCPDFDLCVPVSQLLAGGGRS